MARNPLPTVLRLLVSCCVAGILVVCCPRTGTAGELFPAGDFEVGNSRVLVSGYPGYESPGVVELETREPISGKVSLRLKAKENGGYAIGTTAIPVKKGQSYAVSMQVRSAGRVTVRLEAVGRGPNGLGTIKTVTEKFPKGKGEIHFTFETSVKKGDPKFGLKDAIWIRGTVSGKRDMLVDGLSVIGLGSAPVERLSLADPQPLGVYPVDGKGSMKFFVTPGDSGMARYEVVDFFGSALASGEVAVKGMNPAAPPEIPLTTGRRGYFTVRVSYASDTNADHSAESRRSYVVIRKNAHGAGPERRFGVTYGEVGSKDMIPSGTAVEDFYDVFADMGVGAIRLFSPDDPEVVSEDGRTFDFSIMDILVRCSTARDIQPFIPLGPSSPEKTPEWLRTDSPAGNVDLIGGLRTKKLKMRAQRAMKGETYLSMDKYADYLRTIMTHIKGLGVDYEIWNEPGHKFSPEDAARLTMAARSVRDSVDSKARIIGFSSTKGPGRGQGEDPDRIPEFYRTMLGLAGKDIDIVSYHSGHAYAFLGDQFDPRSQDTGYPLRLLRGLEAQGLGPVPIWDTERATPWRSNSILLPENYVDKEDETDIALDINILISQEELARRLPMVFSAAFRDGVERVFWFNGESGKISGNYVTKRWTLWDMMNEPTASIAAYDAMTELLSGMKVSPKRFEAVNGGRGYLFSSSGKAVFLCYNWKGGRNVVAVAPEAGDVHVYDLMGNPLERAQGVPGMIEVGPDPVYIVAGNAGYEGFVIQE